MGDNSVHQEVEKAIKKALELLLEEGNLERAQEKYPDLFSLLRSRVALNRHISSDFWHSKE